jgi:thioesterase domain-containing protein/acyl carrier protein
MGNNAVQSGSLDGQIAAEPRLLRRADLSLSTPWKEPQTETEVRLAGIWQQVFGIDAVGAFDDFFEVGGDSFAATALAAEIEATFGIQFTPAHIMDASTVARQAEAIAAKTAPGTTLWPSHLIAARTGGSQPPVFVVHGGLGFAFFKPVFLDVVGRDRPVYLFQAPGLDGRAAPLASVEEIASVYVDSVRRIQPAGSYNIVAMCAGSFIALEMCNQLVEAGHPVAHLVLLDPPASPPAIKDKLAEIKEKRGGKDLQPRARLAIPRMLNLFGGSKDNRVGENKRALNRRDKMHRIIGNIRRRVEQMESVSPEQVPYAIETRAKVVEQLRAAFSKHLPRPYPGKAAMLFNSSKANKMIGDSTFWPSHLGGIEYQVCGADHQEVFGARLMETARFVSRSLEAGQSEGASISE